MILPPQDTERFYRIWWALLRYVNTQKHFIRDFPATSSEGSVKLEDAAKIRDALWKDDTLREKFIAENPDALPTEDLEVVASWKHRVAGNFYVMRHLKKYSIFLSESPAHAYGVLGLISPLEEVVGPYLPVYVQAVLLPFEDKITYDSLMAPYSISFGPGIRADMKTWLRDAEEREGILTSLTPRRKLAADEARSQAHARNEKIIAEFRTALYKSGVSPKMAEQHTGNLQSFADHLLTSSLPRPLLKMQTKDIESYLNDLNPKDVKTCLTSFKRYVRFLWDSGRSEPDALYDLQDLLKSYQHKT